jgi:hypothetical protein
MFCNQFAIMGENDDIPGFDKSCGSKVKGGIPYNMIL